jgi:hypothetical protein
MGRGVALSSGTPQNFKAMRLRARSAAGRMFVFETVSQEPRYIINLTKRHWRGKSRLDIESGLAALASEIHGAASVQSQCRR